MNHRLRNARKDAGLTQAELADRAGVSERTVRDAESGEGTLRRGTMALLAFALGHKVHDFWPGVEISRRKAA